MRTCLSSATTQKAADTFGPCFSYHFIAYVPISGVLYELDGLQRTPISHGPIPASSSSSEWISLAKSVIERRIASYGGSEIAFNLMAICGDQVQAIQEQIEAIEVTKGSAAAGDTGTNMLEDKEMELMHLQGRLQEELQKRERWAVCSIPDCPESDHQC